MTKRKCYLFSEYDGSVRAKSTVFKSEKIAE